MLYVGFGFLLLISGVLMLWATIGLWRTYRASRHWPVTRGVVAKTAVEDMLERRRPFYEVKITYTYTVDEQTYTGGNVYWYPMRFSSRAEAERIVSCYPPGAEVEVHYRPDAPHVSVIHPDPHQRNLAEFAQWGVSCLVAGLVLFLTGAGSVGLIHSLRSWLPFPSLTPTPTLYATFPADDLLLEAEVLGAEWMVVLDLKDKYPDLFSLEQMAGVLASRGYGIEGKQGGVVQTILREDTSTEAVRYFRQRKGAIGHLVETPYQSALADESSLKCGIWQATEYCQALLRYGNYVVELSFVGSVGRGKLERALQAMDDKAADEFGVRYRQ